MADIPNRVRKIIFKCIRELERNNIPVKEVILFGSYARGNYKEESDIDLLIVSPVFKGNRIEDRKIIRKYVIKISSLLEIIPCSLRDYQKRDPFIEEIVKSGIKIFSDKPL